MSRLVEDQCFGLNGIENIRHDVYLHGEALRTEPCRYHMGENFLLTIFHSLGQETVLSALSELYRSRKVTEESAYRTFLKHVPHDQKEEFRDLYRRLHGGPYAYPDTDRSDDHADEAVDATVIAVGETVEGNLDYMFDFDYFRFRAEASQTYRMTVNHGTLRSTSVTLFAADGLTVESWISRMRASSGPEILWVAPSSGEYHFAVQNFGGKKGTYTLAITPVPSLVELATASDWYRDGLDHADIYRAEPRALRALEEIDRNNPELARVMSRWAWIFDKDMHVRETSVVEYIAGLDEKVPEFVPRIVELPWISDGIDRWEASAVGELYFTAIHYDLDFAVELATAPWVVDGVTLLEGLFGIGSLSTMSGEHEHGFFDVRDGTSEDRDIPASPDLARQMMSLIDSQPNENDLFLLMSLNTIRRHYPDGFERLLAEPWFVDGLDEEERIYLIAASGAERRDQLFEPYTMASATIALPHSGDVNLWAVQYGPFPSGQDILAQMEEAVRGSEQFWELPFPVDDVILFLEDGQKCRLKDRLECRGKHIGRLMFLYTYEGKVSSGSVNHEVAHYYFHAGPAWFREGGAVFVAFYIENDGDVPEIQPSEYCAEQGLDNLQALNDIGGGPLWDSCRYSMGLHFLAALRDTMGEEAWLSALRAFYLEFGYEGLHVSTADSPEDEEVYQVFMEYTPPELVDEVKDVFRRLHGGPFVDTEY